MRIVALILLIGVYALGCARTKVHDLQTAKNGSPSGQAPNPGFLPAQLIVTPDDVLIGKVALVNRGGRFVVLNFPIGRVPAKEQHFNLYRRGLKVGEARASGMQHDDNLVADLVTGEAELGDEARTD
jgi:hypothetical protein